jgi:hypothetical protein
MVVTILPQPPCCTATCSEASHVAHEHDGQCKNHGVLNGGAPGAKNNCFSPERPIEQAIAQENHSKRDTHGNYNHNAASHNIPYKSKFYYNKSSKTLITRHIEDFPTN